jgi:two-component system LytT family response regulator
MKLRVVIADDEPLARSRLARWLQAEGDLEIVAECEDGPSTVATLRRTDCDALFLDIQMPGLNGFEVLEALPPERVPWTVFVTAYDEHAVRAFEARALDYLLKPVSQARLAATLARVRAQYDAAEPRERFHAWLAERAAASRLAIPNGDRLTFVPTGEIDWIESAANYAVIHAGSQTHILRETLGELEKQLPGEIFFRVSRGAIVNLQKVREWHVRDGQPRILLECGADLPISRSRREMARRIAGGG